jgi:hydroxymethylpyrimidine/phosphomethylpyrimidine kinase
MIATQPRIPPIVLAFAAADPTGGAGLQADVLTLASLGCHPLSVVTAVTVQDTAGVEGLSPVDADWVADQARALLEDMPVAAFKIGLPGSVEAIAAIAEILADYPAVPVVCDPVLASGRGDMLADEETIEALVDLLLPQTTLLTPNSLEARRLAQALSDDDDDMAADSVADVATNETATPSDLAGCARRLIDGGCEYVLLTGTHEDTPQVINTLYGSHGVVGAQRWPRLPGSYHGSGCTLASAVAAHLAAGHDIADAVAQAQEYTWHALAAGFRPGMGQFIPDRLFRLRDAAARNT